MSIERKPFQIPAADKKKSWNAGFNFIWPVYENYEIRDGVMREKGQIKRFTAPAAAEPDRIFDFLRKVHQRAARPEAFALEFGLLGHTHVVEPEKRRGGDPLPWFGQQAKDAFEAITLVDAIRAKDEKAIKEFLAKWQRIFWSDKLPHDPMGAAWVALAAIVNPHLAGVARYLEAVPGGLHSVFRPRALVDYVFWAIADSAEGKFTIRRCKGCGSLFVSADIRTEYCPGKNCGVIHRMREYRKRHPGARKRKAGAR